MECHVNHGLKGGAMTSKKLVPHQYQQDAVDFITENKAVLLAADMGLGKTLMVLLAIDKLKTQAVVFGPPKTILDSWPVEIEKWMPHLTYKVVHGPDKTIQDNARYDILLMTYQGLKWLMSQRGVKWTPRMLVMDESSMIKSHSTERFRALCKSSPLWSEYRLALSATPAPNSLHDLWSQYYLLDNGKALGKNISTFRADYCNAFSYPGMSVTLYQFDIKYAQEVYDKIAPITYRLAAKDYIDMPEIVYNNIPCHLTPKLTKQYKDFKKTFVHEIAGIDIEAASTTTLGGKLRQFVQGGLYDLGDENGKNQKWLQIHTLKLDRLKEIVETSAGQPILCALQFKGELETLRKTFPKAPVIAGGTPAAESSRLIKEWNAGAIPLLFCHPASLSHGVNLQSGGHILVWYSLTWSLEQYQQLIGRLYRQGQEHTVIVHHIVMANTIDEHILSILQTKDATQQELLLFLRDYAHGR